MASQKTDQVINIRPGVSILSVLRHLNYKHWFALAEFVDNSLQSFLVSREALGGSSARLSVDIDFESDAPGRFLVRDNAAGIAEADYARAFKPAEIPPDRTGLSEFGMGMKSAACWLAHKWTVRTKALGETIERTVQFDVANIVQNRIEELAIAPNPRPPNDHYTEIVLEDLTDCPHGRTVGKIKEHLASIYRVFLANGTLTLRFNREPLVYQPPAILNAPYYKTPAGPAVNWQKIIEFDFGAGQKAWGFAALREKASISSAGFALFRRNRLIQGSGDEGYRPSAIFGQSNSFTYQRLFGELHLEGFEVSHTKDGFRWAEHEEVFLSLLAEELDKPPVPLLAQAEGHRVRPSRKAVADGAKEAVDRTAEVVAKDVPDVLEFEIEEGPENAPPPTALPSIDELVAGRTIDLELHGQPWRIVLELTADPAISDWVSVSDQPISREAGIDRRCICVRLSLAHPFMDRFGGTDAASIEPLLRLAAAVGLAETAAREAGVTMAGTFRRNINELLRSALCNP